jgi:hypothetical protein
MTVTVTLLKLFKTDFYIRMGDRFRNVVMQDSRERELELYQNHQVRRHRSNNL